MRLHNFYTACERIFKLVAKEVNGGVPATEDWHKRLLQQMALDVNNLRPAVISRETLKALDEMLGFRHVVRNLYGFELEPERIDKLIRLALDVLPRFRKEIDDFTRFLVSLSSGPSKTA